MSQIIKNTYKLVTLDITFVISEENQATKIPVLPCFFNS